MYVSYTFKVKLTYFFCYYFWILHWLHVCMYKFTFIIMMFYDSITRLYSGSSLIRTVQYHSPRAHVGMARFQNGGSNRIFTAGDIIAGEQMLESKNTQSSLKGLPQSTVVIATYTVTILKGQTWNGKKSEFSIHLQSFFNQFSAVTRKVFRSKLPPVAREFSGGGAFALGFECNCDITPALFDRGSRVY